MPKTPSRAVLALALATVLLLLAPLSAAAAPSDASAPLGPARLADWLGWLAQLWPSAATAAQETSPNLDPNGVGTLPPALGLTDPDAATTQSASGDGETSPNMDPDG
jgi:hypothetical protein